MNIPVLRNRPARHVFLQKHGLSDRPSGSGKGADLKALIDRLGFVQLDSVNTFARAHDLILWSRKQQYRPKALGHLLHRDRQLFEHWTHDAAIMPIESFAHWRLRFARDEAWLAARWKDWRRDDFHAKIDDVLRHISDNGPCTSGQVGTDESRGSGGWWDWHPSKTALEYLWRSGQVSVLRREGFTKVYDLTERVIPPEHLNRRHDVDETIDWCCRGALDRLGFATSGELAAFWDHVTPAEAKAWCATALAEGRIIAVDVEPVDGKPRRCFAWPDLMDVPAAAPVPRVRILSPFDPALRDRKRAERLFGFHYRIEIFVPAPKRTYGYYVFPVIEGDRLIGRIDMKRTDGALAVRAFWPEDGVKMGQGRQSGLIAELERAATFGGCGALEFADGWIR
ncbi:MAG: winged helix-turn-helix domain-containing protein [Yoonia sp.]|uniref:winged helix-turn-helix domain-containing protein n=1 Tax=Yoonia sp. TaxID=2212373 RepID=UPI003EF68107